MRLVVLCQKVGLSGGTVYTGNSINVSPGGLLMEINTHGLKQGELLSVEMSIPPTDGLLKYGGRFSSYARVLRVKRTEPTDTSGNQTLQTIALEFCESPKLSV